MSTPGPGEDPSSSTSSAVHQSPQATGSGQPPDHPNHTAIEEEERAPSASSGKDQSGSGGAASTSSAQKQDETSAKPKLYCQCPDPGTKSRNLVVCIDGTANQFSKKNSNVVELYSRLEKDATQLTYYNSGIGTYVRESNTVAHLKQSIVNGWDMAVAWNLKKIILSAYRWLSDNYRPGDKIYLFGFSRGAYQVRIIAGMIATVGLLHRGNEEQIAFAYELYLANIDRSLARGSWRILIECFKRLFVVIPRLIAQSARSPPADTHPGASPTMAHPPEGGFSHYRRLEENLSKENPSTGDLSKQETPVVRPSEDSQPAQSATKDPKSEPDPPKDLHSPEDPTKGQPKEDKPNKHAPKSKGKPADSSPTPGANSANSAQMPQGQPTPGVNWTNSSQTPQEEAKALSENFKETFSHEHATVHLVGVWDTVSSVGVTRGQSFPETVNGMTNVCGCRHAVSLDERRDKFLPEFFNGGAGPAYSRKERRILTQEERKAQPGRLDRAKEVWFVGSHSDVGGGNSENVKLDSFGPSLRWMLYESLQYGLRVKLKVKGWGSSQHTKSMTNVWRILEIYPFRRLTYRDPHDPDKTKRWPPHLCGGRRMQPGQLIHASVVRHMKEHPGYTPAARGPCDENGGILKWADIRDVKDTPAFIEKDADSPAIKILETLRDAAPSGITENVLKPLEDLVKVRGGSQSIIDAAADGATSLLEALHHAAVELTSEAEVDVRRRRAVSVIAGALVLFPSAPPQTPKYFTPFLKSWLRLEDSQTQKKVAGLFGTDYLALERHTKAVLSVAYSPNGKSIASGSVDNTVRLWDAQTGHPIGEPLRGHTDDVKSVAFSPDETRLASGSDDRTIRIWDVATQQAVGSPLTGHDFWVLSVAFSPDGKHVVSGSVDRTVRIWEVETGRAVGEPLLGHTDWVWSVAVSPDGRRIASGSGDATVRIWDFEMHEEVRVLEGHSAPVWSVVFTPDSKRVVSGSRNNTIRAWDVESGKTVLGPLRGHEDDVNTVAVSSDGKYLASGSDDKTVRLWNAETGEAVGEPLRGHTHMVRSVAFSPDGRRVVSGSWDNTLMIWDVDNPSSITSS